jgi:hypothetical protein
LTHAAAEVVRVLAQTTRSIGDFDKLQQLHRSRVRLLRVHIHMKLKPLCQLTADGE